MCGRAGRGCGGGCGAKVCLNDGVNEGNTSVQRGRPGYSREDVIKAAVAQFNSHGYDATSMGQVATTLGISKSALYHHISSKEEILELTVSAALRRLEAVVEEASALNVSPGERVRSLLHGSVEVLLDDPESVALLLRLRGNSEVELKALERRRRLTRSVIPLVADAQESGDLRDDLDAAVLTRTIFGVVNSLSDWYEPGGKLGPEEVTAVIEGMVFEGIWPRG